MHTPQWARHDYLIRSETCTSLPAGTDAQGDVGDSALTAVEARPSRLSATCKVVDIIFAFTNRQTDVTEKYFVRVDVTEKFPFLVTKLSPYNDR